MQTSFTRGLNEFKGTKLPSICIIRLMGSSYYIAVQIFHTIGFGLFWWRSNILWRWQEERCEGGSLLQQQLFNVIAFVYSQYFPFLDRPWQCLFISKLIEPMFMLDQAQNDLHITGMSAKFVRCLTNPHIVWKYAGHFVLGPYKKWDWTILLMDKHFQRLSREVKPGRVL